MHIDADLKLMLIDAEFLHSFCLAVGREGGEAGEWLKAARRHQPPVNWRSQCGKVPAAEVSYMAIVQLSST